jgi:hypothetical protein
MEWENFVPELLIVAAGAFFVYLGNKRIKAIETDKDEWILTLKELQADKIQRRQHEHEDRTRRTDGEKQALANANPLIQQVYDGARKYVQTRDVRCLNPAFAAQEQMHGIILKLPISPRRVAERLPAQMLSIAHSYRVKGDEVLNEEQSGERVETLMDELEETHLEALREALKEWRDVRDPEKHQG